MPGRSKMLLHDLPFLTREVAAKHKVAAAAASVAVVVVGYIGSCPSRVQIS